MLHFLKFLPQGSCFASVQWGKLDLMSIQKPMFKYCRLIVLIWVSVVLPFHKCLRLLRLGLYTVSTPRVDNDAPVVAHICYISLLRRNCYDKYLSCEQEDFCEQYIKFKGNWEILSGERLKLFCWKLISYSLTALERRSQFKCWVILFPKINRFITTALLFNYLCSYV